MKKGFLRAIILIALIAPSISLAAPQVDISKDQTLLNLSFERGLDPFRVNEALEALKASNECAGKKTIEICKGCCKSTFWPQNPRGYKNCVQECKDEFSDGLQSSVNQF